MIYAYISAFRKDQSEEVDKEFRASCVYFALDPREARCEVFTDAKRFSILTNKTGTSILIACRACRRTSGRLCGIYYLDSEGRVKGEKERKGGDGADREKRERETGSAL